MFSLRNIFTKDLYRCPLSEFEDTIAGIDRAEIVAPNGNPLIGRNEFAQRLAFHAPVFLKSEIEKVHLTKRYDLFFATCGSPRDLLMIDASRYLWDACSIKVCLIDELWVKAIAEHRYFLRILKDFDLVALYYSGTVGPLSEQIGRPCFFVPPGIDAIRFCPHPQKLERVVDIYSVGRRSRSTHEALLQMAERRNLFYLHDSIEGTKAFNSNEHRRLFANTAKRSKYFTVNPGQIDRPEKRGSQIEIGNRYFEGIAAGTILVGEIPKNGEFEKLFDWPDAPMSGSGARSAQTTRTGSATVSQKSSGGDGRSCALLRTTTTAASPAAAESAIGRALPGMSQSASRAMAVANAKAKRSSRRGTARRTRSSDANRETSPSGVLPASSRPSGPPPRGGRAAPGAGRRSARASDCALRGA